MKKYMILLIIAVSGPSMANVCGDAAASINSENNMRVLIDKNHRWYRAADIVCMDGPGGIIRTDGKHIVVAGNGEVFGLFDFKKEKKNIEILKEAN